MTQESYISQVNIMAANAVMLQFLGKLTNIESNIPTGGGTTPPGTGSTPSIGTPGGTGPLSPTDQESIKELSSRYKKYTDQAYKHAIKLHRERCALEAYYFWLENNCPTAVREAAQIGFQGNIVGFDNLSDPKLSQNIKNILVKDDQLVENGMSINSPGTPGIVGNIGGFSYKNEGSKYNPDTKKTGVFGKTYVEFKAHGISSKSGVSLLKYFQDYELTSSSAANLASSDDLNIGDNLIGLSIISMKWYSPRLMAVEETPNNVPY